MSLPDPRYTTHYSDNYKGKFSFRQNIFLLPASAKEQWCEPGYQPKRRDKGYALTVNDYPFHDIHYGGPMWSQYVHTPFKTENKHVVNN